VKYLKKFNESVDPEVKFKDTCQDYLVYLLDDGFTISTDVQLNENEKDDILFLYIEPDTNTYRNSHKGYTWDCIKDRLSPLLSLLANKSLGYRLLQMELHFWSTTDLRYNIHDIRELINNEMEVKWGRITKIVLEVKKI
jgi:hypothetical protein